MNKTPNNKSLVDLEQPQYSSYNGTLAKSFQIGVRGVRFLQGVEHPSQGIGKDGDIYILISNADSNIFQKKLGDWFPVESHERNKIVENLTLIAATPKTIAKKENIVLTGRTISDEVIQLSSESNNIFSIEKETSYIINIKLMETPLVDSKNILPNKHELGEVYVRRYTDTAGEDILHFSDSQKIIKFDEQNNIFTFEIQGHLKIPTDWAIFVEILSTNSL